MTDPASTFLPFSKICALLLGDIVGHIHPKAAVRRALKVKNVPSLQSEA